MCLSVCLCICICVCALVLMLALVRVLVLAPVLVLLLVFVAFGLCLRLPLRLCLCVCLHLCAWWFLCVCGLWRVLALNIALVLLVPGRVLVLFFCVCLRVLFSGWFEGKPKQQHMFFWGGLLIFLASHHT